eukprot:1159767-Pelagomonas_calceolata.AAC.8
MKGPKAPVGHPQLGMGSFLKTLQMRGSVQSWILCISERLHTERVFIIGAVFVTEVGGLMSSCCLTDRISCRSLHAGAVYSFYMRRSFSALKNQGK